MTEAAPAIIPVLQVDETEEEFLSLEKELEEKFSREFIRVLKRLSYEVAVVGLSEKEACLIVGYDYEKLVAKKQEEVLVQRLFDMKALEYKRGLMKTLSEKARKGDDKLAQWLLEAKDPETFNRRKGAGGGNDDTGEGMLGAAIEFVRKSTLPSGIVREEAGRAFVIGGALKGAEVPKDIRATLSGRAKEIVAAMDKDDAL